MVTTWVNRRGRLPHPRGRRQNGAARSALVLGEGDLDAAACRSNTFELEWPPRSGRMQEFPEIDRAAWFVVDEARAKLVKGQVPFLNRLLERLFA